MAGMDRILEYAAGDLVVRARPGCGWAASEVLAEKGQRLALDGPPGGTVGGVVATERGRARCGCATGCRATC